MVLVNGLSRIMIKSGVSVPVATISARIITPIIAAIIRKRRRKYRAGRT
jgi:hypothetical protein